MPGALRSKRLLALARDEKLVEAMRRGSERAFEVAFERHGPGILGFCRHMLGSAEEAEDAAQHSFAAAFASLQGDDKRELAFKPWLYTIARNRCLSMLRSRREQVSLDTDVATAGLAEHVERRAELRELLGDLRELPEEQRAALLLAELGSLSHVQVGAVLGCEPAKVRALVFRARTGLIQRREARDTPCKEIREQLANLRGGSLRRNELRHHLRACSGCRVYREQVKQQRRMLGVALPVIPSLGWKASVLATVGVGGGSTGGGLVAGLGGLGGGLTAPLGAGGAAKLAAVGVLASGGAMAGGTLLGDAAKAPAPARPVVQAHTPTPAAKRSLPGSAARAAEERAAPAAEKSGGQHGTAPRAAPAGRERLAQTPADAQSRAARGGKEGNAKKTKPAPAAIQSGIRTGHGAGREDKASKLTPAPRGRGPVETPPASTPVRRGPPSLRPKPQPHRKPKVTPPSPVAPTRPSPATQPPQPPQPRPPKPPKQPEPPKDTKQ